MNFSLRISGKHYTIVREHLFPGDGLEAIAFGLCGCHPTDEGIILTVFKVVTIPHHVCTRTQVGVAWPTELIAPLLDEARAKNLSVVKFHSHPEGVDTFSAIDDESDIGLSDSVSNWIISSDSFYGSVILLPDGDVFGRVVMTGGFESLSAVTLVGDAITYFQRKIDETVDDPAFEAHKQLFGRGTVELLSRLKVGIVGCSGTGSFVLEMLMRLGVGSFILVDHDKIENRNLNRIVNSKRSDVGLTKVEALSDAMCEIGLGPKVTPIASNLFAPSAVRAIAGCDAVFGCMDTVEGRHLLNRIATFYVIPYFDLGVHLAADSRGGIDEASGVVHYLQPGGSSLLSRRAYTLEKVRAENLYRTDRQIYQNQLDAGYIEGVNENSPAVASLNATIASLAVNEFLARIHPFRTCNLGDSAIVRFNFMETLIFREEDGEPCTLLAPHVGRGDVEPILNMPSLSN